MIVLSVFAICPNPLGHHRVQAPAEGTALRWHPAARRSPVMPETGWFMDRGKNHGACETSKEQEP